MPKKTPTRRTPAPVKKTATPSIADAKPVAPAFPAELVGKLRDGTVEVAVNAIEVLAKTGDARVVAPLIGVLENADGYCHVVTRAAAAMALGRFNDSAAIAALTVAARDGMAEVSCEAALALGGLKATSAVSTLLDIAANSSGFYLNVSRHAAIRSLGRMKAVAARSVLATIAGSASEDAAIIAAAREALAQL